jgi:hypothetical protein
MALDTMKLAILYKRMLGMMSKQIQNKKNAQTAGEYGKAEGWIEALEVIANTIEDLDNE